MGKAVPSSVGTQRDCLAESLPVSSAGLAQLPAVRGTLGVVIFPCSTVTVDVYGSPQQAWEPPHGRESGSSMQKVSSDQRTNPLCLLGLEELLSS